MRRLTAPMLDLGPLDGPVLLFGGPYGNLPATRALQDRAHALGIAPERTICTGDVTAYCAAPAETVALIRRWAVPVVMGNCEEQLGADGDDCGCGFEAGSACDTLSAHWYAHARAALDDDAKAWMRGLPRTIGFSLNGIRFAVVHGAPSHISRFVFASADDATLAAELDATGADAVIGGHCGLPFTRVLGDGRLWHNPGVIGMPANDGTPRGWFSVLTPTADGVAVARHALDYDHGRAAAAMRARGLPAGYADGLVSGLWPNMDILPAAERAARGRPLAAGTRNWAPGA